VTILCDFEESDAIFKVRRERDQIFQKD
jgi:hypothetical protein